MADVSVSIASTVVTRSTASASGGSSGGSSATPIGNAGGDLSGSYPTPVLAATINTTTQFTAARLAGSSSYQAQPIADAYIASAASWNEAASWGNHALAGYATESWANANFVPKTGGTFTGVATISTSVDTPLVLEALLSTGVGVSFEDGDGSATLQWLGADGQFNLSGGLVVNNDTEINGQLDINDGSNEFSISSWGSLVTLFTQNSSQLALGTNGVGSVLINTDGTIDLSYALESTSTITATSFTDSGGNSTQWNTAYGWGDHSVEGYLTSSDLSGYATESWVSSQGYALASSLATVATSGSYDDLTDKPTIPTNNNELTNGAGYITSAALSNVAYKNATNTFTLSQTINGGDFTLFGGDTDSVFRVYRNFSSDAVGFLLRNQTGATVIQANSNSGEVTAASFLTPSHGNSTQWNTAYGWGDHSTQGYLTSSDLSGYAIESWVTTNFESSFSKNTAFNKNFGTASGTVAEGNDSRILNGQTAYGWGDHSVEGYLTSSDLSGYATESWVSSQGYALASSLATVATSGSYDDLTDKPTIPTNNNQLTNGAGYITSAALGNVAYKNVANTFTLSQTINGGLNLNGNVTLGNSVIRDFNFNNNALLSDTRAVIIRALTSSEGDIDKRGGQLYFYTRMPNSSSFQVPLQLNGVNAVFSGSISTSSHGNSTQWNTAYGWGDHSTQGYLTSSDLSGYATESWVSSQGYTTNIGDITAVSAGTNLTGGGTGGAVTVNLASAISGLTSVSATNMTVDDKIISSGDTDTYMQFHAANQWRVVAGGSERLEVNTSGALVTGTLTATGTMYASEWQQSSDSRLKKELGPVNGLGLVAQLEPKYYDKQGKKEFGFYADKLPEDLAFMASKMENGYMSMAYGNLHAIAIQAIKELNQEVQQLRSVLERNNLL
ncbi:beta strand repeat-containing protein [Roseivirga pacifica]|uniref:beta strand repeat-containing protein n=1 Tax=Roseivirga pacifica TaxID=1267423 RepID=UPI0020945E4E|nr:hypothetical protein [Roseivirga pacifica]MCO6358539.1 hypothetical protein [Roseivirga pacifica]MCO6369094.1 hypothetical protein [Roseivirga pacifica]MCO6372202.1 hypothetical protein [Roseivirga pacifica]MCO6374270.1 hypothetical protein [Roseivirga pacifica]MCO6380933.1 hypothetical protein [Roseivirga pacifica]